MATLAARRDDPAAVAFLIGPETRQHPDEAAGDGRPTRAALLLFRKEGKPRNSMSSSWPRSYGRAASRLVRSSTRPRTRLDFVSAAVFFDSVVFVLLCSSELFFCFFFIPSS